MVFIGSRSLDASREVEVWWRLFEEDFPGELLEVVPAELVPDVFALRPPSRHSRIRVESSAANLAGLNEPGRAFCAVVQSGVAELMVIGPPTEEVWDEVATLWNALRAQIKT